MRLAAREHAQASRTTTKNPEIRDRRTVHTDERPITGNESKIMNLAVAAHAKNPVRRTSHTLSRQKIRKRQPTAPCKGQGIRKRQATAAIHVDEL